MDRIEFEAPAYLTCNCCTGITTSLTRFVTRGGGLFAVYFIKYSHSHPGIANILVGLGAWGDDDADAEAARSAFAFRLGRIGGDYNLSVIDAAASPWPGQVLLGHKLSATEARAHPAFNDAFAICNAMLDHDVALQTFFAG
jgi:hypothetical protein